LVEVWKDNWIPDLELLIEPSPTNTLEPDARACQLIDWANGGWKQELVAQCFTATIAHKILSIPLSHWQNVDKVIWPKNPKGVYTVKSGYHIANEHLYGQRDTTVSQIGVDKNEWQWLWSLKLPQKVKVFSWK
ncbi:hypothetical protein CFOL_v3_08829, partial [Cephalotus follicularis]